MNAAAVQELAKRIDELEKESELEPFIPIKRLTPKTISNEIYVAADDMFISAKKTSTLKLPANPKSDCVIYAHNADGTTLTIDANGKNINGEKKALVRRKGNGLQIYYFIDSNEYIAI
jgi:hypothetical protein